MATAATTFAEPFPVSGWRHEVANFYTALGYAEWRRHKMGADAAAVEPATAKTIDQFTDAELAKMVRDSVYVQNANFGHGPTDCRFLLVFAVPYGPEEVATLPVALDAFAELLQAPDWNERSIEVYDHATGEHHQVTRETETT
jgi:hypothetical protein